MFSIQKTSRRGRLGLIAIAGVVSASIRGAHDNHHLGSLLVDPYWVGFYITNFQDGFRRRALIGSLCRLLQPAGISVILINVLAVTALIGVLALFVRGVLRLSSPEAPRASVFVFALLASAIGSVYIEVLGDTLQIAFLVFALFALLPAVRIGNYAARFALAFTGLVLAFFVHEASVFLLAPCIPFLARSRVKLVDFALPFVAMLALIALSLHWSHLDTHLTYHAISVPRGMPLEDLAATPGFVELLQMEKADDFGSRSKMIFFLIKCASIFGLGLAGLAAAANSFSREALQRFLTAFAAIMIFSVPLWIVAHDWGRFLAYTFLLASVSASTQPGLEFGFANDFLRRLTSRMAEIGKSSAFQCAALLLLLASPYYQSRIFGMHIRDLLSSVVIVGVGLLSLRGPLAAHGNGVDEPDPVALRE